MSDLNARARALVDAARAEDRTPRAARERVRSALEGRLGAAVFEPLHDHLPAHPASGPRPRAPSEPSPKGRAPIPREGISGGANATGVGLGAAKVAGAALFALVIFGAGVLVGRVTAPANVPVPSTVPVQAPAATLSVTATPAPTQAATVEPAKPPPAEPAASAEARTAPRPLPPPRHTAAPLRDPPAPSAAATTPAPSPAPNADTLGPETALLREAQASMREGDASAALRKLDSMASKYPGGVLREERSAARVLALCAAGKVAEARAEAQRFLREAPHSPVAERVRASCGMSPR